MERFSFGLFESLTYSPGCLCQTTTSTATVTRPLQLPLEVPALTLFCWLVLLTFTSACADPAQFNFAGPAVGALIQKLLQ